MLPRSPSAQGAVSGLSVAIGYLLGTLAGYGAGRGRRGGGRRRARAVAAMAGPAARPGRHGAAVADGPGADGGGDAGLVRSAAAGRPPGRPRDPAVRRAPVAPAPPPAGPRHHRGGVRGRRCGRDPRRRPRRVLRRVNDRFRRYDTTTAPGVVAPTTASVSGSPASLVPWETLGEYGRTFVAGTTSPAELRAFHGPGGRGHGADPGLRRAAVGRLARRAGRPRGPAPSGGRSLEWSP